MSTKLPQLTRELLATIVRMDNPTEGDCKGVSNCLACTCASDKAFDVASELREYTGDDGREAVEIALSLSMDGCDGGK